MKVLTIAEPLVKQLVREPFLGSVRLVTGRVIVAESHSSNRLLAFALRSLGNGPFSLVVDALPPAVVVGASVELRSTAVNLAGVRAELKHVGAWSPWLAPVQGLVSHAPARIPPRLAWCDQMVAASAIDSLTAERLCSGAKQLSRRRIGATSADRGVECLAGLGPGLTPAGDDYLLGVCAALHLLGEADRALQVAGQAAPRTTRFSGAFLLAAGRGEFSEPWHDLRRALIERSPALWRRAHERVTKQGATSGTAAWAGFSSLGLTGLVASSRSGARGEKNGRYIVPW